MSRRACMAFALTALTVSLFASPPRAFALDIPSQKEIAARLEHQERLVRTMKCEYTHVIYPTEAAQAVLLAKKYAKNPREAKTLTQTADYARRATYSATWWRKGEKERWDETYPNSERTRSKAFDGNVVRDVEREKGRAGASLRRLETSHLRDTVRHQPFALVYEFCDTPFSVVIRKGSDFFVEPIMLEGQSCHKVFVRNAKKEYCLLFVFDQQGRMTEWSYLEPKSSKESPVIRQTHSLLEYQDYADPSGETIWFPRKVHIRYFDPATKNGPAVVWGTETITFRDIRFNVEIPDAQFVIDLPADATVYDDVTGQGILPSGSALPAWENPPLPVRSWRWLWIGGAAFLVLLALSLTLLAFRRRRAARTAPGV
jgi:hypothetical protein